MYKANILIILIIYITSCSSGIKQADRWEGLKKGKMRVYVRDGMEDVPENKNFEKNAEKKLLKKANERAVHLFISYIRSNIKDRNRYESFNDDILAIINRAGLKSTDCNDNYCEAIADYEAAGLLEKINLIRKENKKDEEKQHIDEKKKTEKGEIQP